MYATAGGGSGDDPHRDPTGRDLPPNCQPPVVLPQIEKKKTRGQSRGVKTSRLVKSSTTGKLRVLVDRGTFKAIDDHRSDYINMIGMCVRDIVPPYIDRWANVSPADVSRIIPKVRDLFEIEVLGDEQPDDDRFHAEIDLAILRDAKTRFRDWKTDLREHFELHGGAASPAGARSATPPTVHNPDDWSKVVDRFCSAEFQAASKRNKTNRALKKSISTQGSKPFVAHRYTERNKETGKMKGLVDNYGALYKTKSGQWTTETAQKNYEAIVERQTQLTQQATAAQGGEPDQDAIDMAAMESVLGSARDHRRGVGPTLPKLASLGAEIARSTTTESTGSTGRSAHPPPDPYLYNAISTLSSGFQTLIESMRMNNPGVNISIPPDLEALFRASSQPPTTAGPSGHQTPSPSPAQPRPPSAYQPRPSSAYQTPRPSTHQMSPGASTSRAQCASTPQRPQRPPPRPARGRGRGRGRGRAASTPPASTTDEEEELAQFFIP